MVRLLRRRAVVLHTPESTPTVINRETLFISMHIVNSQQLLQIEIKSRQILKIRNKKNNIITIFIKILFCIYFSITGVVSQNETIKQNTNSTHISINEPFTTNGILIA